MKHLKFFSLVLLTALVMALLEVQIEGVTGWAVNLPTWKVEIEILGKNITGYHVYLWLFTFLLCHLPFIFIKWDLKKEFKILAFYIFMTTFEGILWFVVNPAWGVTKFGPGIDWYNEPWFLGFPIEYYFRFGVGILFYKLSNKVDIN